MNNKYINLAKLTTKILLVGDLLVSCWLILLFIVSFVEYIYLENMTFGGSIIMENNGSIVRFAADPNAEGIPINENKGLFYTFWARTLLVLGVLYLILRTILRILNSINSLETFRKENVKSFRKIGKLFMVWFVLAIPTIRSINEEPSLSVGFYLGYVVCALICFVLAEIFSEGNKLMEDNKLTI